MIRRLIVSLALMFTLTASFASNGATAQDQVEAPPIVNVEIILDSSGSMASVTDTGESRMDAAKRVLREVVNSVPDRDGSINVGLRIYGHHGDNTESTKSESCRASELLVPVEGVDRQALLTAIDTAQPTGWTPIARSLTRAGGDFPTGKPNAVNAIVLVTDGVETCDRDPVAAAKDLNEDPNLNVSTYVIGFGTTPEEQQVLTGIADAGKGQLFGAGNAQQLRAALFSVLEELQIVVGAGYVGGNAFGLIPEGVPGELSIVGYGLPIDSNFPEIPFVVRNNAGEDLVGLKVHLTLRGSEGTLLAAGDSLQVFPFFVRAGGLAFGSIYFLGQGTVIPSDAQFEWEVTSTDPRDARFYPAADLDIIEASLFENRIVGTASNGFEVAVDGPISSGVICLDNGGNVIGMAPGFNDSGVIAPDATQSFQIDLFMITYAGYSCPAFLVAANGSGDPRLPETATAPTASVAPPTESSEPAQVTSPTSEFDNQSSSEECLIDPVAEEVVLALRERGLPIGDYIVYTAETDPNDLLGRPGGYISKVNFIDTRYVAGSVDYPVEDGGSVEVFSSDISATARREYLEALALSSPLFAEYDYQTGSVVLRLSKQLLPVEADEFRAQFEGLLLCD